mgnify:CR=1 FL=1
MEKSKNQKNKVRFVVVREFSGEKSMREAFEQLIERQTCEHFEEWLEHREMAQKAVTATMWPSPSGPSWSMTCWWSPAPPSTARASCG